MEGNDILKVKIKSGHSKQPNNIAVGGGGRQAGHGGPFTGITVMGNLGDRPKHSECKPLGPANKYSTERRGNGLSQCPLLTSDWSFLELCAFNFPFLLMETQKQEVEVMGAQCLLKKFMSWCFKIFSLFNAMQCRFNILIILL